MAENGVFEKDVILALALASGATQAMASEQTDVSLRTIQRRLSDPEFRKLVIEYRDSIVARDARQDGVQHDAGGRCAGGAARCR